MMRVLTSHRAAASSGVIMPLGSVHRSHLFCGETKGRLIMTSWGFRNMLSTLFGSLFTLMSVPLFIARRSVAALQSARPNLLGVNTVHRGLAVKVNDDQREVLNELLINY